MSEKFANNWSKETKSSVTRVIVDTLRPTPLREKMGKTIFRLNTVQKSLEDSRLRMEQKESTLFKKCVNAQEARDATTSTMYANECAQIRKMARTALTSQLALEQVAIRLETVKDFGDVASNMLPVVSLVHTLKNRLAGVIPKVSMQLGAIGETLDNLLLEVGEATGSTWDVAASGEEANKILEEAAALAGQKMQDRFPELPTAHASERDFRPTSIDRP